MKQSLKCSVKQHLDSKRLSKQQLQQLHAIQIQSNTTYFSQFKMLAFASVLFFSIILSLYSTQHSGFSTPSIEQRIAEEVAANHLKLKPLEINSNTIQDISEYFKQLNFAPVNPDFISLTKENLLGGRYCSIQGITALQLRMMNSQTNKIQSLYETEYDKKIFKHFPKLAEHGKPITIYVKGMKVDIWVEKDILFALIE